MQCVTLLTSPCTAISVAIIIIFVLSSELDVDVGNALIKCIRNHVSVAEKQSQYGKAVIGQCRNTNKGFFVFSLMSLSLSVCALLRGHVTAPFFIINKNSVSLYLSPVHLSSLQFHIKYNYSFSGIQIFWKCCTLCNKLVTLSLNCFEELHR